MSTDFNPIIGPYMDVHFVAERMGAVISDADDPTADSPNSYVLVTTAEVERMIELLCERSKGKRWSDAESEWSEAEWLAMLDEAVESIPVLAVGSEDFVTLVFPTIPHDNSGKYCRAWDKHSGHSSSSPEYADKEPRPSPFSAEQELARYLQWYRPEERYELVTKITAEHHARRRREASKFRQSAHS